MKVEVIGVFNGDLEVAVNGVFGTDRGFRIDPRGVSDSLRHVAYCLRRLLERGKIKEGQRLHGVSSDILPMEGLYPLPGEDEVPGVRTITALTDEGAIAMTEETTYCC